MIHPLDLIPPLSPPPYCRFHVNDLCRGLHSLQTFTRNPIRGIVHRVLRSICVRAHQMLPCNFLQVRAGGVRSTGRSDSSLPPLHSPFPPQT